MPWFIALYDMTPMKELKLVYVPDEIFPRIERNKSKYSKIDYQKQRTVRILWIYF